MTAEKHNVSVRLTADERERIRVRAAMLGISASTLIHRALELAGYLRPLPAAPVNDRES